MHGFGRLSSPAVAAAFDLSRFHRLIDLGGASGHLAEAVRERYPQMQAQVFDLPEVAKLYPGTIAGDFFTDPLPRLTSIASEGFCTIGRTKKFTGCWPGSSRRCRTGGGLLIAEKLLNPDNIPAHMQSLNMLIGTEGRERSAAEYEALLRAAGFSEVRAALRALTWTRCSRSSSGMRSLSQVRIVAANPILTARRKQVQHHQSSSASTKCGTLGGIRIDFTGIHNAFDAREHELRRALFHHRDLLVVVTVLRDQAALLRYILATVMLSPWIAWRSREAFSFSLCT